MQLTGCGSLHIFFWQELNETKSRLERAQAAAEDFQRRFLQVRPLAHIHPRLESC